VKKPATTVVGFVLVKRPSLRAAVRWRRERPVGSADD
jgi:hypothetical protein